MLRIALTGGIACGKSLVGRMMAERGVAVCDADDLAHALLVRGAPLHRKVTGAFGTAVLGPDGSIDRQAMGRLVFADAGERERLNAIVHPAVKRAWEAWLAECEADSKAAVVIVPLLYEIGAEGGWNAVVCITASEAVQRQRLGERGLLKSEAGLRIAAQMSSADKAERADYVIVNNGTKDILEEQTRKVLNSILEN